MNLNGGDWFFYRRNSIRFDGTFDEWPTHLTELIQCLRIDVLILFGDCRPHHKEAIKIAEERNIEIMVFEEAYLRPDFITCESGGVNGFSLLPKDARHYQACSAAVKP